ncbi:hypothetical protein NXF25_001739 [Crotalus adamanteus]|uniref:Uncharacterized protein n=1 Tax=Crotalus adamanteus TaxID=8729 RepID=A0AAW1C7U1_CROAD
MENSLIMYLVFLYFMFALQYNKKQNAHNIEMAIGSRETQIQLNPGINYIKLEKVQINL